MTAAALATPAKVGNYLGHNYRAAIKSAFVNELHRLHRNSGGYCQFIGSYEREFRGEIGELYQRLLGQAPAILVRLGDEKVRVSVLSRKRFDAYVDVEILVLSNNLRGRDARVGGDEASLDGTSDAGIDRMLTDIQGLILGRDLLAGVDSITELDQAMVYDGDDGQVWLIRAQLRADARPAQIPVEGSRPTVDSIQLDHTIPTAVPPAATKVSTLTENE